jgi:peroxiredoxin
VEPAESASETAGPSVGWRLLVVFAVLASGITIFRLGDDVADPVARGKQAPGFKLPLLDGPGEFDLTETRGQVVLLNFWATWCKPCEDEMPAMDRLYSSLRGEGFEMIAISVDEKPELVSEFRERLGFSFPVLLDPEQVVSRLYQTMGFPESLLLDTNGRIVERYVGPRDWDHKNFSDRIRRLLDEG